MSAVRVVSFPGSIPAFYLYTCIICVFFLQVQKERAEPGNEARAAWEQSSCSPEMRLVRPQLRASLYLPDPGVLLLSAGELLAPPLFGVQL